MTIKKLILATITVIVAQNSYAQYAADALRFSQLRNSSTARFDGLGGSKSAIGGDISSLYGNPAGLGMFSKSEFNLTPSYNSKNNAINISNLSGNGTNNSSSNNLDLNNIGVVFFTKTYKSKDLNKGLLGLSFGIGYQKRNSFQNNFSFNGTTNFNGLSDFFTQQSNDDLENGFPAAPNRLFSNTYFAANQSELTKYDNSAKRYLANTFADSDQKYTVNRTGGTSNVNLSLGGNISNKLFIGASLGFQSFKYNSIEKTNEIGAILPLANKIYNVNYNRNFNTTGNGINLKLGAILKPTNEFRIGASIETPTWYSVTDNYSESFFNNSVVIDGEDSYPFDYSFNTPIRIEGGMAYFFGKKGFISADIGYVDYSSIKFNSGNSSEDIANNRDINSNYTNTINFSLGGEIKLTDNYLMRLGYSSQGNPYLDIDDQSVISYSGGLGYRFGTYYLDVAYVYSGENLNYSNYQLIGNKQPISNINLQRTNVALTFGVRF